MAKKTAQPPRLTKVQREFASKAFPRHDFRNPEKRIILLKIMKETAYHEAGHVAGYFFCDLDRSHLERVSFSPDREYLGHVERFQGMSEDKFLNYLSPPYRRSRGRRLLLYTLAGRGAVWRLCDGKECEKILDDDPEEWDLDGSDLKNAEQIAATMERPYMHRWRILTLAEKWTHEMLAIDDVWQFVEKLAEKLLKEGHVNRDALFELAPIISPYFTHAKWRRRFGVTKNEIKAMGEIQ